MPKLKFEPSEIKAYQQALMRLDDCDYTQDPNLPNQNYTNLTPWPAVLHTFYPRSVWHCNTMRNHADGIFPARLLAERRPHEPLNVFNYRSKIFAAKTKPTFDKVFTSLQKIRRSSDWSIRFENEDKLTRVADGESLEDYTTKKFPFFTDLTNWIFTVMLRKYLIDPNAVVFIRPLEQVAENEILRPFPTIYNSEDVLDYAEADYCVLNIPEGCKYYIKDDEYERGKSLYLVTTQTIWRYDQVNGRGDFAEVEAYQHGLGILPVFKLKGTLVDQAGQQFMYESKISGMLPELDEAAREYSDLQAAKVLNIYPERWEMRNVDCPHCRGRGIIPNPDWTSDCGCPESFRCVECNGMGVITNQGPFSAMIIKPPNVAEGQPSIPTPPAGYIPKDIEVTKYQDGSVEQHLYNALGAISFQFLADVPLAQSGISKGVDRDESNNFTHGVAEDIVADMDQCEKIIALYRYKDLYNAEEITTLMVPIIEVPQNYDILYVATAEKELADAKTNKIDPVILNAMTIDYASKRFNTEPKVRDRLVLVLKLDPFPNILDDAKMSMLQNKGISLEDYVMSSNIQQFVQRAVDEDPNFADLDLVKQKDKLKQYAQELIKANSAATKVITMMPPETGLQPIPGQPGQPGQQPQPAPVIPIPANG